MDGEGALEEQNAAEGTSEEALDGGRTGAAGVEHLLLHRLSPPLPPHKYLGPIFFFFFNFAYLFLGKCTPLLFCVLRLWTKLFVCWEEKNCLNHTNDDFICNT